VAYHQNIPLQTRSFSDGVERTGWDLIGDMIRIKKTEPRTRRGKQGVKCSIGDGPIYLAGSA